MVPLGVVSEPPLLGLMLILALLQQLKMPVPAIGINARDQTQLPLEPYSPLPLLEKISLFRVQHDLPLFGLPNSKLKNYKLLLVA